MDIQETLALLLTISLSLVSIYILIYLLSKWKQIKIPKNTVLLLTGGLGMGKTFISVKETIKHHRKMVFLYYIGKVIKRKSFPKVKPRLYSNIPIQFRLIPFGKVHRAVKLEFLPLGIVIK